MSTTLGKPLSAISLVLLLVVTAAVCKAEEIAEVPAEGLEEQVLAIKKEVLDISAELGQLQEKLMYPADTQVALFVSLAEGDDFRPDAVKIKIDGKNATSYVYSPKELEALQHGGVQRLYTGNIKTGTHTLDVEVTGKTKNDRNSKKKSSHKFYKMNGPKVIEIVLSGSGSTIQSVAD